jgi:hypothetical protein
MFYLVSGAAAAGKSTAVRLLAPRLESVECHDADEKRVRDEYERCSTLEEWIGLALEAQQAGSDFLLASHSPLGELLACPSAPRLDGIVACLLDCSDTARLSRIRERGIDPQWPPTQHTFNWAAWHRLHAWDPRWEPHVIDGNGPPSHTYARWKRWTQDEGRWRVTVIDTTEASVAQTVDLVAAWVEEERNRLQPLSSKTHWWEVLSDSRPHSV